VGTSNSTVRQAERGRRTISFKSFGERRRRVMKGMFIASNRASPSWVVSLESKNQMAGKLAVSALPKSDELENLLSFLAFAQIRIGVAEDVAASILSEKDQHAGLAAAAGRDIVPFNQMTHSARHDFPIECSSTTGLARRWSSIAKRLVDCVRDSDTVKLLSYLVCSHACHVSSPANNAVVPSADSGLEK
jgi:hypothetical protein